MYTATIMARVCLVNPALSGASWMALETKPHTHEKVTIRLGIAWLSAVLKQRGHDVRLIDLRMLRGWNDYIEAVKEYAPEWLGISIITPDAHYANQCAYFAKAYAKFARKSLKIVAGGIHATMFPHQLMKTGFYDYVICGEADFEFANFIDNPDKYPRVFWANTPDLDQLPVPDRELWPDYHRRMSIDSIAEGSMDFALPVAETMIWRGCPFQCTFCCGPGERNLYTKEGRDNKRIPAVRGRSIDHAIEELKYLRKRYGTKSVIFQDDQFVIDKHAVSYFCDRLIEEGFVSAGLEWFAWCRADIICKNEALIEKMARCGLKSLSVGFESFSPRIMKWFKKGVTPEQNFRAAEICRRNNIKILAQSIFGVPTPTGWHREDDLMTLDGLLKIEPTYCATNIFYPDVGSPLHKWCSDNNLIKPTKCGLNHMHKFDFIDYDFIHELQHKVHHELSRIRRQPKQLDKPVKQPAGRIV